ncbi:carbamoyltransferase [Kitasatospora herbaricolor]|uniref:carbamoyltransferase HypF n=1 Tax=Kitasatospora herbaricolor TaxID=68217 RepID=UPI00174D4DD4|nr:carbamoyltransferase HypF [Kitasatospora herbaricolor]MDQ0313126.1 hydrogenase maturation protein HypF [Kitasatospora herbaricolor]GGV40045.1 carbamoyltransferase [Kitasatospora herbaricolor]
MTLDQGLAAPERRRVAVRGVVQGVGFRPFVHKLATELGLHGQVTNTGEGVTAEVEGRPDLVADFCRRLASDAPVLAAVESVSHQELPVTGDRGFSILASGPGGPRRTLIPPDVATCADCLAELADPADRRYRHPFITCTNCGPRFTIVTALPYDRANTTMAGFPMCPECAREYGDPADRRFHAQPVACHACGPVLTLTVPGEPRATGADVIARARRLLAAGAILAVKGIGGYHLACDAGDPRAVALLRRRKARGDKPFALMARALAEIEPYVRLGPAERDLLTGTARPIVLLRRRPGGPRLAEEIAPGSPDLGVMLPYTPLHHLLLGLPGDPPGPGLLVLTSGNLAGEPIVTDDAEALVRLAPLADAWLAHDRPIHVPCDDSVVRICDGEQLPVRRSRGYAPLPVTLPLPVRAALAVGGDLKNTFCLGEGRRAWLSAHVGDMDDLATQQAFGRAVDQLGGITGVTPGLLAADRHPGYRSAGWARRNAAGRPLVQVQHHHAHIAAAMAEHGLDGTRPVIGVAFDGTGYGDDGAVWGGEILLADYDGFRRFAHLRYAPLPGGDATVARPYRMALAQLYAAGIPWTPDLPCVAACPPEERRVLARQLERNLNCVPTSSMGRLFDAAAALAGVCQLAGYEAQAAIELEAAAVAHQEDDGPDYAFALGPAGGVTGPDDLRLVADPGPVLAAMAADLRAGAAPGLLAARFHRAVAALVRRVCAQAREQHGLETVALTGGVFANLLLSTVCARELREDGFTVLRHRLVPPNDGGLALGQLMVAARLAAGEAEQVQS